MSFFHKINVTKCLGHHYAIWTSDSNYLLAQKKKFRPSLRLALISGTDIFPLIFIDFVKQHALGYPVFNSPDIGSFLDGNNWESYNTLIKSDIEI